jgi:hypothetical protein
MNEQEARRQLGTLLAAFPRQEVQAETVAVYVQQLQRMNREVAEEAIANVLRNARVFPAISDLWNAYEPAASRRRAERERMERNLAEDSVSRDVPIAEILSTIPRDNLAFLENQGGALDFPPGDAGKCDDCATESAVRYEYGRQSLCRKCVNSRLRAAEKLETA